MNFYMNIGMVKLSITRALAELKLLDDRIHKIIQNEVFILCKTKRKNFHIQENDFRISATSHFQSVNDLIKRRNMIKIEIIKSNVNTMVEIAGNKMTVAEAIEQKTVMKYKSQLLDMLKVQRLNVINDSEAHKIRVQAKIDTNIELVCGKDKPDATAIQSIAESISKGDPVDIYDPLKLDSVIADLEKTIEDFKTNVDFVLSESNALTTIDV